MSVQIGKFWPRERRVVVKWRYGVYDITRSYEENLNPPMGFWERRQAVDIVGGDIILCEEVMVCPVCCGLGKIDNEVIHLKCPACLGQGWIHPEDWKEWEAWWDSCHPLKGTSS